MTIKFVIDIKHAYLPSKDKSGNAYLGKLNFRVDVSGVDETGCLTRLSSIRVNSGAIVDNWIEICETVSVFSTLNRLATFNENAMLAVDVDKANDATYPRNSPITIPPGTVKIISNHIISSPCGLEEQQRQTGRPVLEYEWDLVNHNGESLKRGLKPAIVWSPETNNSEWSIW